MVKRWFSNLSTGWKAVVVIATAAFIVIQVLSMKLRYAQYQLTKQLRDDIEKVKSDLSNTETATKTAISEGKKSNLKAIETNKSIDKKLQQDEKAINDRVVSDDELRAFLAEYDSR